MCTHPLKAYWSKEVGASGKRGITFNRNASLSGVPFEIGCGQCIDCRLEHSRKWAVRCMHEKMMHNRSDFISLTYDPEFVPPNGSLVKSDLQKFMKRLRKVTGDGLRFYACGEYGAKNGRPHYHVLLFNYDFVDRRYYKTTSRGDTLYTSKVCSELWPLGYSVLGDVTFKSCAYVSRYITDKITGDNAEAHYNGKQPEFTTMSRRPGIGMSWFNKFGNHAYQLGSVVMNGREMSPPRFYDTKYELVDADHLALLKRDRRREALKHRADNTPERRKVRNQVSILNLRRNLKGEL